MSINKLGAAAVLVLLCSVFLCSCGKTENTLMAEEKISQIGVVSLDSEAAIITAEKALDSLNVKEREKVENIDVLTSARSEYERLKHEELFEREMKSVDEIVQPVCQRYGIDDMRLDSICNDKYDFYCKYSSDSFETLSDSKKLNIITDILLLFRDEGNEGIFPEDSEYHKESLKLKIKIKSGGNEYDIWTPTEKTAGLNKNGSTVYEEESEYSKIVNIYYERQSNSSGSKKPGSGSSSGTCPNCGGSGVVKFYYGASDLEAYLDGFDPYELGECPMCHGTGK